MSSTFRVKGELSLDGSKFSAGLSRAEIAASRFSRNVTSAIGSKLAGIFAVGAMAEFSRRTIESAESLVIAAKRMGATVEQVQILRKAAKDSGIEIERMTMAFDMLTVAQSKALQGGPLGDALKARFAKAGISESMLRSQTGAQLAMGPIAAYVKTVSQQDAVAMFKPMFGKAAGAIVDVLRSDLGELGDHMKRMGAIMSTETAVALKQFGDEAQLVSQVLMSQFAPALLAALRALAGWVISLGGGVSGSAAFAGASTAHMGAGSSAIALAKASGIGIVGLIKRASGSSEKEVGDWIKGQMSSAGFNVAAGASASKTASSPWMDALKGLEDSIKIQSDKILHPLAQTMTDLVPAGNKGKSNFGRIESDSLVAVGNFLGAGRTNSVQRIAERQLAVQEQMLTALQSMAVNNQTDEGFGGLD
jgi:hypothetical protein